MPGACACIIATAVYLRRLRPFRRQQPYRRDIPSDGGDLPKLCVVPDAREAKYVSLEAMCVD